MNKFNDPVFKKQYFRDYYKNHKPEMAKTMKKYYVKNKDHLTDYARNYAKNFPEIDLASKKRLATKQGSLLNLTARELMGARISWAKSVRKRDGNSCIICGSTDECNAHHLFYKCHTPLLQLNINNGITLCKNHHYEVHGKMLETMCA